MYIKPKENSEMKAFVLKQYNTPGWVELHELAMPELEAGKVRVRIKAFVITTASKNFQRVYGLGASHIINYKTESIKDRIMELTAQEGVHAVIDTVSPESAYENAKLLRYNGAIVSIQGRPEQWPFDPFTKAITMAEVALGAAYVSGDKESLREMAKAGEVIAKLIVEKKVDPMISHEYRFDQLQQALSQVSSRTTEGKVVVLV